MQMTRELLQLLPKAELHVHLDGSLRPRTMIELAGEAGIVLQSPEATALRHYMLVHDARNLEEYLARFESTLALMQTAGALERIALELAEDAAAEHIRYLEVRFSPILHTRGDLTLHQVVEAVLAGLHTAEQRFGIRTGVIVCGLRQLSPDTSLRLARLAADFKGRGVVAFDLAGAEDGYPPADHIEAFRYAEHANMGVTIHAGEAFGPASIHQAIHTCHADRIGHGTHLVEDPDLLQYVVDFRIPLEVCLTSNVQTHAVPSLGEHPLAFYYRHGVMVTLNTDNRLMSGTTLTEEYCRAHKYLGLSWDELCDISLMGFRAGFLAHSEKEKLLEEVTAEMARLRPTMRAMGDQGQVAN